ncbi:hypothetical protein FPK47_31945, partial [Acinetobacter baumannii]|nr:hypothetical protein [Acinetobacter baumannii]
AGAGPPPRGHGPGARRVRLPGRPPHDAGAARGGRGRIRRRPPRPRTGRGRRPRRPHAPGRGRGRRRRARRAALARHGA